MPHIYPMYKDHPEIFNCLYVHKSAICEIVSHELMYPLENVVLWPRTLTPRETCVAENVPELLFLIDAGGRIAARTQSHADAIKTAITELPDMSTFDLAVWLRPHQNCGFSR